MGHINPDFPYDPYEALGLVQEECSEVIKDISKIRRSGVKYARNNTGIPNWDHLQNEYWDLLIVADLAGLSGEVPKEYYAAKIQRLKEWSNLF